MLTNKKQIRALQAATETIVTAAKGQATDPNAVLKLDQVLLDVATLRVAIEAMAVVVNDTAKAVAELTPHLKPKK